MKTLKLTDQEARSIYKTADASFKKLLESNWSKEFFSEKITDRIKNFDDVLEIIGERYNDVIPWINPKNKDQEAQNALAKIQCITRAYNEGTELDWTNHSQYKYYPWFEKKCGEWSVLVVGYDFTFAGLGSGCYFKSRELAEDAAKKFIEIYKDYLPK